MPKQQQQQAEYQQQLQLHRLMVCCYMEKWLVSPMMITDKLITILICLFPTTKTASLNASHPPLSYKTLYTRQEDSGIKVGFSDILSLSSVWQFHNYVWRAWKIRRVVYKKYFCLVLHMMRQSKMKMKLMFIVKTHTANNHL